MEMMETKEGESEFKRNKIDELMYEGEDRISDLQDILLIDIISRLDITKEAIRTGTLSKRWQHLWPNAHSLIFVKSYDLGRFVSIVDKTITKCRQSNLHKFQIRTTYEVRFESQVTNWIRYAVNRNVKELSLKFWKMSASPMFVLDQFMFINSCFTHLKLQKCVFNPTGAISWSNLKSLSIIRVDYLSEDLIQNILSGSPLLETFKLRECCGFGRIDITSKSVKNLKFSGYMNREEYHEDLEDIIEINAPYIVSLIITGDLWLANLLLVDVSSLVYAHLDYKKLGHYEPTREVSHEETLKGLILSLRHVKELKRGMHCAKVLSRLEAKGSIDPWNLNVVDVSSPLSFDTNGSSPKLADMSHRDSSESGDSEGVVEQVLGTSCGHSHGRVRKLAHTQSQEPVYTQNQVDAMFEAQNKMIATQHRMITAQSSHFSTLVRALIKSGFPVPASIIPENANDENEENDGDDNDDNNDK